MTPTTTETRRVTLDTLRTMKARGRKIAMLTAYDYPTARWAAAAGVHTLLVGDSLGTVLLGHDTTRNTPLVLLLILAEAVRRGAPDVFLVGDMPYEAIAGGPAAVSDAARRFRDEAGCDAVKIETGSEDEVLVERVVADGIVTIAHLGLRPQQVLTPDGYRAQARDRAAVAQLVDDARRMVAAGAQLLLLEAVPNEASQAVVEAVEVPVIGCGAGPACDGHVVVTQDLLGATATRPPRFVPVLANVAQTCEDAIRRYVADIASGAYPGPQHGYRMRE